MRTIVRIVPPEIYSGRDLFLDGIHVSQSVVSH